MVLIVGLFAGLVLFFAWLSGHWFARCLVTITLILPAFILVTFVNGTAMQQQTPSFLYFAWAACLFVAWLVASLPAFFHRRHLRHQLIAPNYGAGRDIRRSLP